VRSSQKSHTFALSDQLKLGGLKMKCLLFLGNLGTPEIIIIAIIVLLLFGGKKIPELMKGLGKGVKNFKEGVKGIEDEIKVDDSTANK
jgi:sec-independent protein translocase protein TatA